MSHDGGPDCAGHGEVGEELRLLALTLLDRFEPGLRSVLAGLRVEAEEAANGTSNASTAAGTPAVCQWCPLCSLVGLLRGDRPELAGRLAEQAGGLLLTLRAVLQQPVHASGDADGAGVPGSSGKAAASDGPGDAGGSGGASRESGAFGSSAGVSPVQRIEVRPADPAGAGGGC